MSWLKRIINGDVFVSSTAQKKELPEGLWTQCPNCSMAIYSSELDHLYHVCPKCDHHMRISARKRLDLMLDEQDRFEVGANIGSVDRLKFVDTKRYKDRLQQAKKKTGENAALVVMRGLLDQKMVVAAAFEFSFIGGSMDSAVGEKFRLGVDEAVKHKCPFICITATGGARMQEGLYSLMQMAKTTACIGKLEHYRIPYFCVLTDPTTGGVSASLAMLGDIILAEPNALIGFAGPRVIEQTVKQTLPEGFQRSELLLKNGAIDQVVHRRDMKKVLSRLIDYLQ